MRVFVYVWGFVTFHLSAMAYARQDVHGEGISCELLC